jgi:hypothetical protein
VTDARRFLVRHQVGRARGWTDYVTEYDSIADAHSAADRRLRDATLRWRQELVDLETGDRWTRQAGFGWLLDN